MSEEWGPWIEHDGRGVPDGIVGKYIHTIFNMPVILIGIGGPLIEWEGVSQGGKSVWTSNPAGYVIRYRIRKPRGLTILEKLLADLPAPQPGKVDA